MTHRRHTIIVPLLFAVLYLVAFDALDWSSAVQVTPGIEILQFELKEPRIMKISVARIDLSTSRFYFKATSRAPEGEWGQPMKDFPNLLIRTIRTKTRKFMTEARAAGDDMVLAVNTSGWSPWQHPFNHREASNLGLIIQNGEMVCPVKGNGSWCFVEYKDGSVDLKLVSKDDDISNIKTCAAGFSQVLKDGAPIPSKRTDLHPRTGFGLSQDKRFLFFIAIDGRQKGYSEGASTVEVAELLKAAGAWKGLNMDGGGSTTLISWDAEKKCIVKWNHHRNDAERLVGCNLGVCLKPAKVPAPAESQFMKKATP